MHGRSDTVTRACAAPIPFGTLIEYWFGELRADAEERIEEHLLGCTLCSAELEALVELGQGLRVTFQNGAIHAVFLAPFIETMKARGMRLREYSVSPSGSVHCTITADDDAVIGRLKAPLAGLGRVDVVGMDEAGGPLFRFNDVPYDPAAGEVLFCPPASLLKQMPAHMEKVRLLAVGPEGERTIADYTFFHAPS
jgi:hypothetical protein